jgi:4-amino-4-deoxy-L-arabinose transferase-like glycosyltransferase
MNAQSHTRQKRLEWLGLALILAVALVLRLYALGIFPDTLSPDEADNGQDALRIIAGHPPDGGFFGLDWKPQPAYSVYMISLSMRLFGENILAIRLPSALLGTLSVLPFFLLVRRQTSAFAALAASLLMATSLWHVHFSRSGWENVQVPCYALGALACLVWAVDSLRIPSRPRRRAWVLFVAAGIFCALGLYSYFSGRLIILVLLAAAVPLIIWEREQRKELLIGFGLTILTAVLLFAPMLPIILSDWEFFNLRSATVLLLRQPEFRMAPIATLWLQISDTISMMWGEATINNKRYAPVGQALLEPITRILLLAGMLLSFWQRRRVETWLWWLLLIIGWFVTQVLTTHTPDPARGTIMIPAMFFFAALSIDWLAQAIARLRGRVRLPVAALGVLLLIAIACTTLHRYVVWQSIPDTREARQPYIQIDEIPDWVATVKDRAVQNLSVLTVGDWRATHGGIVPPVAAPIAQQPQPVPVQPVQPVPVPTTVGSVAQVIDPAPTAPETWPQPVATLELSTDHMVVPRAIVIDAANTVFVLDSTPEVQTISKLGGDGQVALSWGGPGGRNDDGRFVEAWALAIDPDGHILVLDSETGWVHVFDTNGTFLRKWGGPNLQLYKPRALAVGPNGIMYIADTGGRRVLALAPDGTIQATFGDQHTGATGDAILMEPAGLAVANDNTLLVADATAGLVRHYAADGALLELWAIGAEAATDGPRLAVAPDGQIIIILPSRCGMLQLTPDGQTARRIGSCEQRTYLDRPSAIAFAPDGHYLITDLAQGKVFRFQP